MKTNKVLLVIAGVILIYFNIFPLEIYPKGDNKELTIHSIRALIRIIVAVWCGVTANLLNRNYYYILAMLGLFFPVITLFITGFMKSKKSN